MWNGRRSPHCEGLRGLEPLDEGYIQDEENALKDASIIFKNPFLRKMVADTKLQGPKCTSPLTDGKTQPIRALPASWYTSKEFYELERRAIFSSKWLLITHQVRLANPGEWIKFETGGYEFVITRDRKGQVNAFHNVCRHRAYPIVEATSGKNQILSCKYHGWSYSLDGKLTKAPWYEDVTGFDKSKNSLFRIHTKVDGDGFIWVNLDASDTPEPWDKDFEGIDQQERLKKHDLNDYVFDHEFELDGDANWKLCVDNFNECYHCPTAHPTIPTLLDVDTLRSDSKDGYTIHETAQSEEQKRDGLGIVTTYYFPNVSTNVLFLPQAAGRTKMHYQIFKNKNSPQELFDLINNLYKQVMTEDKGLAVNVQKNMNRGLFVNGQMHPRVESAALHHQDKVRSAVKEHLEKEKIAAKQLWPAVRTLDTDALTREDEELCAGLACDSSDQGVLSW